MNVATVMQQESKFVHMEMDRPLFKEAFCDFNGSHQIVGRKRHFDKKYFVYSRDTQKVIKDPEVDKMEILDVVLLPNERIVFFADSRKRLSFMRTRERELPLLYVLDKLEKSPVFRNVVFGLFSYIFFIGVMRFRIYSFDEARFALGYDQALEYKIHFFLPERFRKRVAKRKSKLFLLFHLYIVRISIRDVYNNYLRTSDINTPVYIRMLQPGMNYTFNMKARFNDKYRKRHYLFNTRSYKLASENAELFIRKSVTGQYVIVITSMMSRLIAIKEWFAKAVSVFSLNKKKYDIYFEKFAAGASESAFELFKYAHGRGEPCVYLLEREHPEFEKLKGQYGKSLCAQNSFRSFLRIFRARSFISSDLVSHIQRRLYDNDRLIKKKILSNKKKIFLQHGVCLATNIFERGYFNRKVPIAPDYIVVNSQYEKDLFLENTTYRNRNLMLTGLPNLDLYTAERTQDKKEITFLLTWRPWDLTGQLEETSYLGRYLAFLNMLKEEPFYKDKKVNVVLHPKSKLILQEQFPSVYEQYADILYEGDIKDALLASKVLVSDYSSVVFFAFTGGSNVIFYWEDKERAESEYGAPNILQKDISFGDIAESMGDLQQLIERNYSQPQQKQHIQRFDQLVECKDGYNTKQTYDHIYDYILGDKELEPEIELEGEFESGTAVETEQMAQEEINS